MWINVWCTCADYQSATATGHVKHCQIGVHTQAPGGGARAPLLVTPVTFGTASRDWAGPQPAQAFPRCIPNVTVHPSTASVPITVL